MENTQFSKIQISFTPTSHIDDDLIRLLLVARPLLTFIRLSSSIEKLPESPTSCSKVLLVQVALTDVYPLPTDL